MDESVGAWALCELLIDLDSASISALQYSTLTLSSQEYHFLRQGVSSFDRLKEEVSLKMIL